jgi:hypothetical protein
MVLAGSAGAMHNAPLDEMFADAMAGFSEEVPSLLERINFARFLSHRIGKR